MLHAGSDPGRNALADCISGLKAPERSEGAYTGNKNGIEKERKSGKEYCAGAGRKTCFSAFFFGESVV